MRYAGLILLAGAAAVTASAQDNQPPKGIAMRDFSISDSPCGYGHDKSVEKVLTVRVEINTAKPSPDSPVATLELRNYSAKTITAYVFNYTFTYGGKTDHYGALGTDLVYEMAMMRGSGEQNFPNSTFPPAGLSRKRSEEAEGAGNLKCFHAW